MYKKIVVRLCVDRAGRARIGYAADLAVRLGAVLTVCLPDLMPADEPAVRHWLRSQLLAERPELAVAVVASADLSALCSSETLFVAEPTFPGFPDGVQVWPMDESRWCRSETPKILLPFGSRAVPACLVEAIHALAPACGNVVAYHTTWRNRSLPSSAAASEHMESAAKEAFAGLAARLPGFKVELAVETAPSVTAGIHQHALRFGCSLVAMVPSHRVIRGSYADDLLARSCVPVLVVREVPS